MPNKIQRPLRQAGRARAFEACGVFWRFGFSASRARFQPSVLHYSHEGWGLGRWDGCKGRVGTRRAYLDRAGDEDDGGDTGLIDESINQSNMCVPRYSTKRRDTSGVATQ